MSSSSSFSSVRSNPSANMPYEIEELLESEKSDFEVGQEGGHVDDDSDMKAYAPSTRIRIRLYPQTFCCGFKSLRVHTYLDSLRFRPSTRICENDTNPIRTR